MSDTCNCGNPQFGFDCVCEWVEKYPGDREFTCEFCGLYTAGEARCNKCEENEPDMEQCLVRGLLCCKYCGNPFDQQFQHTTCGLE